MSAHIDWSKSPKTARWWGLFASIQAESFGADIISHSCYKYPKGVNTRDTVSLDI